MPTLLTLIPALSACIQASYLLSAGVWQIPAEGSSAHLGTCPGLWRRRAHCPPAGFRTPPVFPLHPRHRAKEIRARQYVVHGSPWVFPLCKGLQGAGTPWGTFATNVPPLLNCFSSGWYQNYAMKVSVLSSSALFLIISWEVAQRRLAESIGRKALKANAYVLIAF